MALYEMKPEEIEKSKTETLAVRFYCKSLIAVFKTMLMRFRVEFSSKYDPFLDTQ